MNEVRRFLRYTLPGLACAIQLLIALFISDNQLVIDFISKKDNATGIGLVLAAFFASGGIGYIFAILYFSFYWSNPLLKLVTIDHKQLFLNLEDDIEIKNAQGIKVPLSDIDKKDAWKIFTRYWYSKYKSFDCIKEINPTVDRLVDVTHALGATIIGTLIAILVWLCIDLDHSVLLLAIWSFLLYRMIRTYLGTLTSFQSIVNSTMTEVIKKERRLTQAPVIIWFSK